MSRSLATCFLLVIFPLCAFGRNAVNTDTRIKGADEANIKDFPYQASVEFLSFHRCGGVIISRTWILTAASCLYRINILYPQGIRIRVGSSYRELGGQVLDVADMVLHSNFSWPNGDFDIALVQLQQPIALSSTARIIRLPIGGDPDIEGYHANVTGWGVTAEDGDVSNVLQRVEVPIINRSVCADLYPEGRVTGNIICADFYEGGNCTGDIGNPLVIDSVLYGLVPLELDCAQPPTPGLYTNIGVFRDWITEQTGI